MTRRLIIAAVCAGIGWAWAVRAVAHDRITTTVTWDREIAPIMNARCVTCHGAAGQTPVSLATYEAARPWARAIRQQVLTRRMPIWHAARGYGAFANDPSLSPFEISLIVAWVDGGAPKMAASRGLQPAAPPSLIVRQAEPQVPAEGRQVHVSCGGEAVPLGVLTGIQPRLDRGGSVRVTAVLPDGRREVIGWFRDVDPGAAPIYWLRTPLALATGARFVTEVTASQSCTLALHLR